MQLVIHPPIRQKLKEKHDVEEHEIIECFANVTQGFLRDSREDPDSDPPTHWFIEQTDYGRWLLVAFIQKGKETIIKSAYEPDEKQKYTYRKLTTK